MVTDIIQAIETKEQKKKEGLPENGDEFLSHHFFVVL